MLPRLLKTFFADEIWILIALDGIKIQRTSRQFPLSKPNIVQVETIQFPRTLALKNGDELDLNALAEQLKRVFEAPIYQNAKPRIVLSNHFVRYAVIPWNQELSTPEEREAYVQHCFVQAFGDAMRHWNRQVNPARYGVDSLASAVNQELINRINSVFHQFEQPAPAIYPHFMLAINHMFDEIQSDQTFASISKLTSFWFVHIAQKRLCIGLYGGENWRVVTSVMAMQDVVTQIKTIIHRELIHHNLPAALPVLILCADAEMNTMFRTLRAPFVLLNANHLDTPSRHNQSFEQDWVMQ